ncbi:MAG: hypothetical protein BMS9Abin33_0930 [Gammaproteobacteria bacterium]|nr:MAG: hypothetical protein BMS9Abin33_0930 [Gammaproteobacteria bacterium]
MELSSEDQLRLNVLLANNIDAVRIDEQKMTLYALSGEEEATVKLNPNCRSERYLRGVRELLSGHVLGSPGGYPIFLKRWTRMGQMRNANLAGLLRLGEPEAVVAVAGAPGLDDELARRAWWASPTSDTARCMLANKTVIQGPMGKILAEHLVEHLPFETEPLIIIESVRLILQRGLINEVIRQKLWVRGKHKCAYHIGFLVATPDDLPEPAPARHDLAEHASALQQLETEGNVYARLLQQVLDAQGQSFIAVAETVMRKPYDQDDVVALLNAIENYFSCVSSGNNKDQDIQNIINETCAECDTAKDEALATLLQAVPSLQSEIRAMMVLARSGEAIVTPVFSRTTAIGTLMRKKLEPVTTRLFEQFAILQGKAC